jgi:hypothetical protein
MGGEGPAKAGDVPKSQRLISVARPVTRNPAQYRPAEPHHLREQKQQQTPIAVQVPLVLHYWVPSDQLGMAQPSAPPR